jgi:L-arabinonolactonase
MSLNCVVEAKNILGEGPVWCPREQVLYWMDMVGQKLFRLDPATSAVKTWELPLTIGSFALRENGGLIMALRDGFYFFDLVTQKLTPQKLLIKKDEVGICFNDGKCDRKGRFWAGTKHIKETDSLGELYRYSPSGEATRMETGILVSNGPAFSPDNTIFYFADSPRKVIYSYAFDIETGNLSNRKIFANNEGQPGYPDGATVDSEGCLWCAEWNGWRVVRYTPAGKVDRIIETPVARPTSCQFGGKDLKTLYVTSASIGQDMSKQPLAGGLFAIDVDVAGLPEPRFAG